MRGAVMYAPGDVRVEERPDPAITAPTDPIIRLTATCVCGSDLWSWRGTDPVTQPTPMGHEYAGIVEEAGAAVRTVKPGQFVVGSFMQGARKCTRGHWAGTCTSRPLAWAAWACPRATGPTPATGTR